MNKIFAIAAFAGALTLAASCSQEEPASSADGSLTIKVSLPDEMATRATGNGSSAAKLAYYVYDDSGAFILKGDQDFPANSLSTTVSLDLVTGAKYQVAFFAYNPNGNAYTFTDAGEVTFNYAAMAQSETAALDYDCFYSLENITVSPGTEASTTLYRPVAQINWGTGDMTNTAVSKAYPDGVFTTFATTACTTFNLLSGEATNPTAITLSTPQNSNSFTDYTFPVTGYSALNVFYVLVPTGANAELQDLTLTVASSATGTAMNTISVPSAPVQRNFRTNIYGNLLTNKFDINVTKSAEWGGSNDFPLVNSLDSFVAAVKTGGDVTISGDIDVSSYNDPADKAKNHDIILPEDTHITVPSGSSLTLGDNRLSIASGKKLVIDGEGSITGGGVYSVIGENGSDITIGGNVRIVNTFGSPYTGTINTSSDITINGGVIESACGGAVVCNYANQGQEGKCVINAGTFYNKGSGDYVVSINGQGEMTVNGGNFFGYFGCLRADSSNARTATVVINDGTFVTYGTGNTYYAVAADPEGWDAPKSNITITGGNFFAVNNTLYCKDGSTLNLQGGFYKSIAPYSPASGYTVKDIVETITVENPVTGEDVEIPLTKQVLKQ